MRGKLTLFISLYSFSSRWRYGFGAAGTADMQRRDNSCQRCRVDVAVGGAFLSARHRTKYVGTPGLCGGSSPSTPASGMGSEAEGIGRDHSQVRPT